MSDVLTVQLSRTRAVVILGCLLLAGAFLFLTGTVGGLLAASRSALLSGTVGGGLQASSARPCRESAPPAQSSEPVDASNAKAAGSSQVAAAVPAVASAPAQAVAPVAAPALAEANAPAAASDSAKPGASSSVPGPAPDVAAASTSVDTVPLAVKVCSFASKESAENMVKSLAVAGFHASMIHSTGAYGKSWYVVRLGPFTSWNDASAVATQLAVAQNVRPMIGPAR